MFNRILEIIKNHCKPFQAIGPNYKKMQAVDEYSATLHILKEFKDELIRAVNSYDTCLILSGFDPQLVKKASDEFKKIIMLKY
jgi:hypothetical protein